MVQDGAKLIYRHAFGVHGPIRNNVEFVTFADDTGVQKEHVVHPVGQHVAMYRMEVSNVAGYSPPS